MDETKKALLSIELDTAALTQNAEKAKAIIRDLTDQLNLLKEAGQKDTQMFKDLSTQLKATNTDITATTRALTAYTEALAKKTQAEKNTKQASGSNSASQIEDVPKTPLIAQTDMSVANDAIKSNEKFNQTIADQNEKWAEEAIVRKSALIDAIATDDDSGQKATIKRLKDFNATVAAVDKKFDDERKKHDNKHKLDVAILEAKNAEKAKKESVDKKKIDDEAQNHLKLSFDAEVKLLNTRYKAHEAVFSKVGKLYEADSTQAKAALQVKKGFALADIAMSTEQSVATTILSTKKAVSNDYTLGPIIGTALAGVDIAAGVADVISTIADGVKQAENIGSIKLATGGIFQSNGLGSYLTGPGSGTSDSINARLSNGESVINARSTQMFAPILSAINQMGGGVAFNTGSAGGHYAVGGLFNGSNALNDGSTELAGARAMNDMVKTLAANLPRQVLVVEDVQASLQNKVMLQNMSNF